MQNKSHKKQIKREFSLPKPKIHSILNRERTFSNEPRKYSENLGKPRKFSKKTSFKELFIQADLKKSQSFEENSGKMPETGLFLDKPATKSISNNYLTKKVLISQLKRDFEKNTVNDEKFDRERLSYFYRFRMASLLKNLGFQKLYTKKGKNSPKKAGKIKKVIQNLNKKLNFSKFCKFI